MAELCRGGYLCIPIFAIMLFFFEKKHYIYTTGLFDGANMLDSLMIDIYRYGIGFVGSISALYAGSWLMKNSEKIKICKRTIADGFNCVGRRSLEIYILSVSLLSSYLSVLVEFLRNYTAYGMIQMSTIFYNLVLTPILAVVYTIGLYWIIKWMDKINISRFVFGRS